MKNLVLALFLSTALIGCQSTPETYLTQPAIKIEQAELSKYWVQKKSKSSFKYPPSKIPTKKGTVFLSYLIDSNGDVFNPKVVKSTPDNSWDKFALKFLKQEKYVNTEMNPIKIPVMVTTEFDFGSQ